MRIDIVPCNILESIGPLAVDGWPHSLVDYETYDGIFISLKRQIFSNPMKLIKKIKNKYEN
jgi:hypothetical protein